MAAGSHSLTLERLYAWEKKLYDEVKVILHLGFFGKKHLGFFLVYALWEIVLVNALASCAGW